VAVASAGPYASLHLAPEITTPAPHNSVFYRPDAFSATQPTASKHCPNVYMTVKIEKKSCMGCLAGQTPAPHHSVFYRPDALPDA